jgi:hypothetical protein
MIFFWLEKWPDDELEKRWDYRLHDRFQTWLASTWVTDFCNWVNEKKKRKIEIRIDRYDTWGMDHTLSLLVVPMLKQLKESKHGYPLADVEDAPHIGEGDRDPNDGSDSLADARWNWILDEMIWAHEQIIDEESDKNYRDPYEPGETPEDYAFMSLKESLEIGKFNKEKFDVYETRMKNGLRLFGKYYRSLWD